MAGEIDGPDPVAEADQIGAALVLFAGMQGAYYRKLRAEGFTKAQAFELVTQWTEARIAAETDEDDD